MYKNKVLSNFSAAVYTLLTALAVLCLCATLLFAPGVKPANAAAIGFTEFDFQTMDSTAIADKFVPYYSADNENMAADLNMDNWTEDATGVTSHIYNAVGGSPWENNSFLMQKAEENYRYFEAETTFKISTTNDNSYTGIALGLTNTSKSPKSSGNNGAHVFVTNWGHLYIEGFLYNNTRGSATAAPQTDAEWQSDKYCNDANDAGDAMTPSDSNYWYNSQLNVDHTLRVRVTDNAVEATLDPGTGVERTLTYTFGATGGITVGAVGLYASNQASTFRNFKIKPLNADGTDKQTADTTGLTENSFKSPGFTQRVKSYHAAEDGNDWNTVEKTFAQNWDLDVSAGILKSKSNDTSNAGTVRETDSLALAGIKYDYFEISATYKFTSWSTYAGGKYQTAGFMFGWNDFTRSAAYGENAGGGKVYIDNDGHMNISGHLINETNGTISGVGAAETGGIIYSGGNPRNVSDGSVNPWWASENWNVAHTIKLRVTEGRIEFILDEGTVVKRSIVYTFNPLFQGIAKGSIGLYGSNHPAIFYDKIEVRTLDAGGDPVQVVPVESVAFADDITLNRALYSTLKIEPVILPLNATFNDFSLSVSDGTVADVIGTDMLLFKKTGTVTVTLTSEYDDTKIDTIEFTVGERAGGSLFIDLTDEAMAAKLSAYYQAGGNSSDVAALEELDAHWNLDNVNGVITRQNNLGGSVSENYSELYFNRTFKSFEISFLMKGSAAQGWAGVMFGKNNYSTFFDQGDAAYIATHDRKATFWGQTVGAWDDTGNQDTADYYRINDWNLVKLQVYGTDASRTVKFYINDMAQPIIENQKAVGVTAGKVCLFTTSSEVSFKEINFNYLTDTGAAIPYIATESVTVSNKITTAEVGSSHTLAAVSLPLNGTNAGISYISSDSSIASVTAEGVIMFHSTGTAIIKAVSKDDPDIRDEMTVTVTGKQIAGLAITNKITSAEVGDVLTLTVTRTPSDAVGSYEFVSSDTNVATVSAAGVVTFVGAGPVTITVRAEGNASVADTMTVTVTDNDDNDDGGDNNGDGGNDDAGCKSGCSGNKESAALLLILPAAFFAVKRKVIGK